MQCRYRITGANSGRSCRVKSFVFDEGVTAWQVRPAEDWKKLDLQMVRFYSCVREQQEEIHGSSNVSSPTEIQSSRSGVETQAPVESEADVEAESGSARGKTDGGNGHKRAKNELKLSEALDLLDPSQDDHWSGSGKPDIKLLRELTGRVVLRSEVDQAAPWMTRSYLAANAAEKR